VGCSGPVAPWVLFGPSGGAEIIITWGFLVSS
jgi:hypothetical protein